VEFWSSGVLEFGSCGVLEFWSSGVLEFCSFAVPRAVRGTSPRTPYAVRSPHAVPLAIARVVRRTKVSPYTARRTACACLTVAGACVFLWIPERVGGDAEYPDTSRTRPVIRR